MQPTPWITGHVISEDRKLAGASPVRLPGDDVPAGHQPLMPAQTPSVLDTGRAAELGVQAQDRRPPAAGPG